MDSSVSRSHSAHLRAPGGVDEVAADPRPTAQAASRSPQRPAPSRTLLCGGQVGGTSSPPSRGGSARTLACASRAGLTLKRARGWGCTEQTPGLNVTAFLRDSPCAGALGSSQLLSPPQRSPLVAGDPFRGVADFSCRETESPSTQVASVCPIRLCHLAQAHCPVTQTRHDLVVGAPAAGRLGRFRFALLGIMLLL